MGLLEESRLVAVGPLGPASGSLRGLSWGGWWRREPWLGGHQSEALGSGVAMGPRDPSGGAQGGGRGTGLGVVGPKERF